MTPREFEFTPKTAPSLAILRSRILVAVGLAVLALSDDARADSAGSPGPAASHKAEPTPAPQAAAAPWSALSPNVAADVRAGRPLVTYVVVPLCSNEQINCGSVVAGRPDALATNIYWGAIFGHRRFFDRKRSGFTLVEASPGPALGEEKRLERVVYRRRVSGVPWGLQEGTTVEQLVVFAAFHGAAIDDAVKRFWTLATEGGRVRFSDGGRERDEAIHVAGYAGHNRLMDGLRLPPPPAASKGPRAIPSFVMACLSDRYFSEALRAAGSEPLAMTRSLMAPEGYVVDAIVSALGENGTRTAIRARAVAASAKWQGVAPGDAAAIFIKLP